MDSQLRELVPFLRDRNPQVRQISLSNILPQTPPGSPHRSIFFAGLKAGGLQTKPTETDIIRDLKLLCRDQLSIAHDAFRALVNLSDSPLLQPTLSEVEFLRFIVSYIIHPRSTLADLASMLLSNLTASAAACSALISLKISIIPTSSNNGHFYATQSRCATSPAPDPYPTGEVKEVLALPLLLDAFSAVQPDTVDPSQKLRKGDLHFLASVFANISATPSGRSFFLEAQTSDPLQPGNNLEYPLAKIVSFTEHKDTIRRGGVVSTIKNCAFHHAGHKAILSPEAEKVTVPPSTLTAPGIDALPYILLPLAGPEEFDLEDQERLPEPLQFLPPSKKREPDAALRSMHLETLLLLCHTRWGRDHLREHGVYEIVRAQHVQETVEKILEHIERLVVLLKGDEPTNPKELEQRDGTINSEEALLGGPQGKGSIQAPVDLVEDDDNKIEEV